MEKYDVIIIGAGFGGLACGITLSREGFKVLVLEKERSLGGCFQSFRRGRYILDTGIHYVGSLSEGQIMHQYFKYYGIADKLKLLKLDEDGFDVIRFGDGREFRHAMGYERFIDTLAADFPDEVDGIRSYCDTIRHVGNMISPEVLRSGHISSGGMEYMGRPIYDEICRCTGNGLLRNILAGSNTLYGGEKEKSSIYEHAMVNHSNIEGAYRFVGGTQHVADAMVDVIRANGGEVRNLSAVTKIHLEGPKAEYVEVNGEERIACDWLISAIHPSLTLSLLENNSVIKKAFFTRVNSLENSYGIFTTYLLFKPATVPYINRNYYLYRREDTWDMHLDYRGYNVPAVLMSMQPGKDIRYCDVATLMTPMFKEDYSRWENTLSGHRGPEYLEFKQAMEERMIEFVSSHFPEFRGNIEKVCSSSPLSYRDYTGTPDGSAYGIVKDWHNPMVNHLPPRTKIGNLLITGQNLNLHGAIGVAVSASVTCSEILGTEYLTKKIGNA